MSKEKKEREIPLRIAIVTTTPSYFLPLLEERNCRVFAYKPDEIEKAIETINIYRNQQVFDGVFVDYFPGVDKKVYELQGINPGLCIRYFHTRFYSEDNTAKILHPAIKSLSELEQALKDIKQYRKR